MRGLPVRLERSRAVRAAVVGCTQVLCLAAVSACDDAASPRPPSFTYQVTDSSGTRSFRGDASFVLFHIGPWADDWAVQVRLGDSLEFIHETLREGELPAPGRYTVSNSAVDDTTFTFLPMHVGYLFVHPDPAVSSMTLDHVGTERVAGRFEVRIEPGRRQARTFVGEFDARRRGGRP